MICHSKPLSFSYAIIIIILFASFSGAVEEQINKWSVYEISLTTANSYASAYTQASVTAQFTGPNGEQKTVKGFWDGDVNGKSIFKIRFTPTKEGAWTYKTTSIDSGLNGKSGTINVIKPLSNSKGFVRFNPVNPYRFVFDSGDKYFMVGQTYYEIINNAMAGDKWKTAIDNTKLNGMNKVRMLVIPWSTGNESGAPLKYHSSSPFISGNHNSLNLAHWKKFDEIIKYLDSKGMMAEIILFTDPPADAFETDAQDKRYLRYAISRFAAYPNVVWSLSNEWDFVCDSTDAVCISKFENLGNIVRNEDPWGKEGNALRALSIHQKTNIDFSWFDSEWPSHASFQFGLRSSKENYFFGDQWGNAGILNNIKNSKKMPVVNDEYGYIGEYAGADRGTANDRKDHRNTIWGIYTAGGYGTFGDKRTFDNAQVISSSDWHDAPEYGDVKRLVNFFTTKGIEYWKMSSKNSLVTNGNRVYVLGQDGIAYIVYAANGGSFTLDLPSPVNGTGYKVIKYDPTDGTETSLADISGAPKTFNFDANDRVLYIKNSAPIVICVDNDGDKYGTGCSLGLDCNDKDSKEFPNQIWYKDTDNDNYGTGTPITQCTRPIGYKTSTELNNKISGDCNDNNISINPGAAEICDGKDNNCNGLIDEGGICGGKCGNNVIDSGEQCDGLNLNGKSCISLGFNKGTLSCSNDCSGFNTNLCSTTLSCGLTSAVWSKTASIKGESIQLTVKGSNCNGKNINFKVWEYDTATSITKASINPLSSTFSGDTATSVWTAEYVADEGSDPEYYFEAVLAENNTIKINSGTQLDKLLKVSQIVSPINLIVNSPANKEYENINIPLNYSAVNAEACGYMLDGNTISTSCKVSTSLNLRPSNLFEKVNHTITVFAKTKSDEVRKSRAFSIEYTREHDIIYKEFSGKGQTTNLNNLNDDELKSVRLILDDNQHGKIEFLEKINLTSNANPKTINLDNLIEISQNKIEVRTDLMAELNKEARLTFLNISFDEPKLLRNNNDCTNCVIESYDKKNLVLTVKVPGFSSYEVKEGKVEQPSDSSGSGSGGSGGGGGGGSSRRTSNVIVNNPLIENLASTNDDKTELEIEENNLEEVSIKDTLNENSLSFINYKKWLQKDNLKNIIFLNGIIILIIAISIYIYKTKL